MPMTRNAAPKVVMIQESEDNTVKVQKSKQVNGRMKNLEVITNPEPY